MSFASFRDVVLIRSITLYRQGWIACSFINLVTSVRQGESDDFSQDGILLGLKQFANLTLYKQTEAFKVKVELSYLRPIDVILLKELYKLVGGLKYWGDLL